MKDFGLQLYTLRNKISDGNVCEIMKYIKDVGYSYVQPAGKPEIVESYAKAAIEAGLLVKGSIIGLANIYENLDKVIAIHKEIGADDIGCSGFFNSLSEVEEFIGKMNFVSERLSKEGITLSYHNHSKEFIRFENGKSPFEMLVESLDERILFMPDTYWLQHGGMDVRRCIENLSGRIKVLHLKDAKMTADGIAFAEIGEGNLYWQGIIESARAAGVRDFVVEQDNCDRDPLESIKISAQFVKNKI